MLICSDMGELVSVIVPVFNAEKYISETIKSVLNQYHSSIELLLVDDGSIDKSLSVINSFSDARIKLIKQTNAGACAARNLGFQHSKGKFIQFLDADDLLSANKIAVQVKVAQQNPDCVVNGSWGRFYNSTEEDIHWMPHPNIRKDLRPLEWLLLNHMSQTACWLTPRKLVEAAGPWREDLKVNQDGEFFSRVILESKKVLFTPEAKVYYRSGVPTSISAGIQQTDAIRSRFKTIELLEQRLLSRENSIRVQNVLANMYQGFIYSYYPKELDLIAIAVSKVKQFGGSAMQVPGGKLYKFLSCIFGWKTISWIKYKVGRL